MTHIVIVLGCSKVLDGGTKSHYTPKSHAYGRLMKTVEVYNNLEDQKTEEKQKTEEQKTEEQKTEEQKTEEQKTEEIENQKNQKTEEQKNQKTENKIVICSGGFGQAAKMRNFLVENGLNGENVFCEPYSKNTIENCIFSYDLISKWLHSEPTCNGDLIDPSNITLHLVTDEYHIQRSEIIFRYFAHRINLDVIKCYGSKFLDYLLDPSDINLKEIGFSYQNDMTIAQQFLPNSLLQYKNWYPMAKDYHERDVSKN